MRRLAARVILVAGLVFIHGEFHTEASVGTASCFADVPSVSNKAAQQQIIGLRDRSASPTRPGAVSSRRSSSSNSPRCALISTDRVLRGGGNMPVTPPAPGHKFKVSMVEGVLHYLNLWPRNHLVLNGGDDNDTAAAATIGIDLRKSITALYAAHVSEDGSGVNYAALGASRELADYTKLAQRLQAVDVCVMSEEEKVAFFINTYNSLLIHAFAAMGAPGNMLSRLRLYAVASYNIGGNTYSLNDIENGILRGNAKPPTPNAKLPFPSGDPRAPLACLRPDPRIHFALNCGAKGCPPIRFYRAEQIDGDLKRASDAFCAGVQVDDGGQVGLSMIFKWYAADFSERGDDRGVVEWIAQHLPEGDAKRSKLEGLIASGKAHVKHLPYDWDLNKK